MAKLQKYLFDLDFGAPLLPAGANDMLGATVEAPLVEEPFEEEPPPPPTFSEEELTLARDQAYEAGRQAGLEAAQADSERLIGTALTIIAQQFQDLAATQADANEACLREAIRVAAAIARKLLPEFSRRHGTVEIEGVVHECVSHLDREPKVTIRANPAQLDAIRDGAKRAAEAAAFEGKLVFHADQRVALGDCRVEWGDGGAERDQDRIWAEIESVVDRALAADSAAGGETPLPDSPPLAAL